MAYHQEQLALFALPNTDIKEEERKEDDAEEEEGDSDDGKLSSGAAPTKLLVFDRTLTPIVSPTPTISPTPSKSRSVRNSGSSDGSDWRALSAARTRLSSSEDDLTIRTKGNSVFKSGDTEVQIRDGTEIVIHGSPDVNRFGGGETSSQGEIEDHSSRFDRPALRSRAGDASQGS